MSSSPGSSSTAPTLRRSAVGAKTPAFPELDERRDGMWLWVGVTVGQGNNVFTHGNKLKRVTFKLLPSRADAPGGKPRGLESIRSTLEERVAKGTCLMFDKWPSTMAAVRHLGFKSSPPANHTVTFRDRASGFHSNDVESEINRIKKFYRRR